MNLKILIVSVLLFLHSNILFAQTKQEEDASVLFNIIFFENEAVNSNFLSSVYLYRVDNFIITDFGKDTFEVKYHYPYATFDKNVFNNIRDSLFKSNKKYFLILKLDIKKQTCIQIPFFSLLSDNTLMISRKNSKAKKFDCYYTLIPDNPEFLPKTIICTGDVCR